MRRADRREASRTDQRRVRESRGEMYGRTREFPRQAQHERERLPVVNVETPVHRLRA